MKKLVLAFAIFASALLVTVRAQDEGDDKEKQHRFHVTIWVTGVNDPIEVDNVTADLSDGLLTVTIPKAGGRGTRRISVS